MTAPILSMLVLPAVYLLIHRRAFAKIGHHRLTPSRRVLRRE